MTGLRPLAVDVLDPTQRSMYDAVVASPRAQGRGRSILVRDDGTLTGPFDPWLRSPVIGGLLERVGMALRTDAAVSAVVREVVILVVAKAWNASFEWSVHSVIARSVCVPEHVIGAIAAGEPVTSDDPAITAAHDVAHELVYGRALAPRTLDRALDVLGERATVEVVINVGFYQLVSATIESFSPPEPAQPSAKAVGE